MLYCCVPECSNSWKTGYSMHRLPRNNERKQQWIANIKRSNIDLSKDWFVCEVNFIYCILLDTFKNCINIINIQYY